MLNSLRNKRSLNLWDNAIRFGKLAGFCPLWMVRFWASLKRVNVWIIAIAVWVVMVAFGFSVLTIYSLTAGPTSVESIAGTYKPPTAESLTLDRPWQLVIGLHPKCPCSSSSVAELKKLMELNSNQMRCRALVFVPNKVLRDWAETPSVAALRAIPGVITEFDYGGEALQKAGILTSGGTILFDRNDKILFHGGITPSRGHEGPNLGSESITAIVEGRPSPTTVTPIFGCRIHIAPSRTK